MSVDDILFDENIPKGLYNNELYNYIVDKYGDIKCFISRDERYGYLCLFTKFGYAFISSSCYNHTLIEEKFSYSFLFAIKCTINNKFNLELYNKYKELIKNTEITFLTEEKDTVIRQKDLLITDLQKKYQELEEKYKKEQQKNEVLLDLYQNKICSDSSRNTDTKYIQLQELYNEQLKEIINLKKENEDLNSEIKELLISSIIRVKELLKENVELKKLDKECLICYESTETYYMCKPCKHVLKIHTNCILRVNRCPICNQSTTTKERVYIV